MIGAPLFDSWFVTIYAPFSRPWSFIALQWVVVFCGALTFVHAWRRLRSGDGNALFAWVSISIYGLMMEVLSYNVFKNFTHGQFPIMFYRRQLPLYVVAIYSVLMYTGFEIVKRFRLGRAVEPVAAGLLMVALDMPFDMLGPRAGWWSWSATDPNIAYRWLGVPVTSYCWYLFFGGTIAFLARSLAQRTKDLTGRRAWKLLLTIPTAVLTIVLGILLFIPFHILVAVGIPDGTVVGGLLALSAGVLLWARKSRIQEPDRLLAAVPLIFTGLLLGTALVFWNGGSLGRSAVAVIALAAAFSGTVGTAAFRRA